MRSRPYQPKERYAISETGTGFACAKLSEVHSSPRVAQVVRMTDRLAMLAPSG